MLPQVLKKGTLIVTVTVTVTVVAAVAATVTATVAQTCRRAVFVRKGVSRTNPKHLLPLYLSFRRLLQVPL